ncbi:MAG: hypothetical protein GF311_04860 [Candidatus Lokiarchaeota archaeon]|nr:hypothetical protein [Candidatus Lokiarchaeota archaeon]
MSGPPNKLKRKHRILGYFTQLEKYRINLALKQYNISSYSEFLRQAAFFYIRFLELLKNEELDRSSINVTSPAKNRSVNSNIPKTSPGEVKLNEQNKMEIMKLVINEMKERFSNGSLFE